LGDGEISLLSFLWFALGLGSLLVALCLCSLLLRLHKTLADVERTLQTVDEALREVTPEIRGSLGNVNDITAGVNLALKVAGGGASRLGSSLGEVAGSANRGVAAAFHGARASTVSLWRSFREG
jgi:uncharacterized protein YoxC